MQNIVVAAVIILLAAGAIFYMRREKKKGRGCLGCSNASFCSYGKNGQGCSKKNTTENEKND